MFLKANLGMWCQVSTYFWLTWSASRIPQPPGHGVQNKAMKTSGWKTLVICDMTAYRVIRAKVTV